jgi:hypothetical protein
VLLKIFPQRLMLKYLMVPHLLKIIKLRLMVNYVVEIHAPSHGIVFQVSFALSSKEGRPIIYVGQRMRLQIC